MNTKLPTWVVFAMMVAGLAIIGTAACPLEGVSIGISNDAVCAGDTVFFEGGITCDRVDMSKPITWSWIAPAGIVPGPAPHNTASYNTTGSEPGIYTVTVCASGTDVDGNAWSGGATASFLVGECCADEFLMTGYDCCVDPPRPDEPFSLADQCCTEDCHLVNKKTDYATLLRCCPDRAVDPNNAKTPNGCGGQNGFASKAVPNRPFGVANFKPACDIHDNCYETCNSVKATCDTNFRTNMRAICDARFPGMLGLPARNACKALAQTYYVFVSSPLGHPFYKKGQEEDCLCCP